MKNLISSIKIHGRDANEKTDEELQFEIEKLKKRSKIEGLHKILSEWFAIVQEISFRKIGLKHFDTQIIAGYYLHNGKIVEMKTGEGKTLASTLAISLNALTKKGVHVVTVNDYLAERDQKWMGKIYNGLGLTSGLVKANSSISQKKKSYNSDITYLTNSELVFDFLRDSSSYFPSEKVQRPFNYCLIDEIDSILIDEARTPLILSTPEKNLNINKLYLAQSITELLEKTLDFEIDEKKREIHLTENGYFKSKQMLGLKSLYEEDEPWMLEILNSLKANYLFKLNKDYIILNNKIVIVDEFTGRIMEDRRWSMGIHEAIEMKERVPIRSGTKTKSSITYQNFFPFYSKLAGMTGTGKTAEKEFKEIYNLDVICIPTNKPMIREERSDFVYQTELAKWKSVLNIAKSCYEKEQPFLIGTASIEKSEFLSDLFKASNLPHQILNAKPENIARESEIISQAGKLKALTIATNMAGRGTDIILGGNPIFAVKKKIEEFFLEKNIEQNNEKVKEIILKVNQDYKEFEKLENHIKSLPFSLESCSLSLKELYEILYKELLPIWEKENQMVKNLGGLYVLGTERHESRRIDNQLRGRSGRQGDPGISQFIVSLEDELIQIFGGNNLKKWVDFLLEDKDIPLESSFLTQSLEKAQQKVELSNYEMRKNIFQYDEILNNQRKEIFEGRNEILLQNIFDDLSLRYGESVLDEKLKGITKKKKIAELDKSFGFYFFQKKKLKNKFFFYKQLWINYELKLASSNIYQLGFLKKNRLMILLSILDISSTEHLDKMNYIRDTINWRAYGQQNPLTEYNLEAFESYQGMFKKIRSSMLYYLLSKSLY